MPNQVDDALLHAMSGTELSRVRTELHRRRILAAISPHPVQADSQPAPHRYLEICPCCGIQFGYTDCAGGDINRRRQLYRNWRERWIGQGMQWKSIRERPADWNAVQQLRNIGVEIKI